MVKVNKDGKTKQEVLIESRKLTITAIQGAILITSIILVLLNTGSTQLFFLNIQHLVLLCRRYF